MSEPDLGPRLPVDPDRFHAYRDMWWVVFVVLFGWLGVKNIWISLQEADFRHFYVGLVFLFIASLMSVVE